MNSGTLLTGSDGVTCISCGTRTMLAIGAVSRRKSKLSCSNSVALIAALLPAMSSV
jgi:hypothetical protein